VTTRDIASLLNADGAAIIRGQVAINAPIKAIGQYKVPLALHPEIEVAVTIVVARSAEEAERIKRGEDVSVRRTEEEEEAAAAASAAEAFFEPGTGEETDREETAEAAPEAEPKKPAGKKKGGAED
jgi:large subunit ribosomal protein L9